MFQRNLASPWALTFTALALALALLAPAHALAAGKPSAKDVRAAMQKLDPNIDVLEVATTPLTDLYEVVFKGGDGNKGIFYINGSLNYVISGSIIDIDKRMSLTQQKMEDLTRVDFNTLPLKDALLLGSKDAKYKVAVFDDPD